MIQFPGSFEKSNLVSMEQRMKIRSKLIPGMMAMLTTLLGVSGCTDIPEALNLKIFEKYTASEEKRAADMAGTWNLRVTTPTGTGTPSFKIEQTGEDLSGTYTGRFGSSPLSGKVDGSEFMITFSSSGLPMTYDGTVNGDRMEGRVDYGGQAEGAFIGTR
jgi:hypothetical protein